MQLIYSLVTYVLLQHSVVLLTQVQALHIDMEQLHILNCIAQETVINAMYYDSVYDYKCVH